MRRFARALPVLLPLAAVASLAFFGHRIATFYTDWLWYDSVGYRGIFHRIYGARIFLFSVFGGASFLLAYVNLVLADRISPPTPVTMGTGGAGGNQLALYPTRTDQPISRFWRFLLSFRRVLDLLYVAGALIFAALAGYTAQTQWDDFIRFTNPVAFGKVDPIFGKDIGWYVFTLPFYQYVQGWLLTVLIIVGVGVALLYLYQEGINSASGQAMVLPHVRGHLSALLALILVVKAWGYWFDRYDLMYRGVSFPGAGYTDIHVRLPMLYILLPLAILAALAAGINIWRRAVTPPAIFLGLWLIASLLGVVIPAAVQRLGAQPNEATREAPYIARALAATRAAYGLDGIKVKDFPPPGKSAASGLRRDADLLLRTRIWDEAPMAEAFAQQQGLRQFYDFPRVDIDRYPAGGASQSLHQVFLSAREIDPNNLEGRAQTWPNRYLRFTHGYGAAVSAGERVRPDGTPEYLLRDAPPVAAAPEFALSQPRIYYGVGAGMNQYAVVRTKQAEFDSPAESGTGFRENIYDGRGGVRLTALAKMAFAARFATWSLLLSQDITPDSRLMMVRQVSERIKRLAPFLLLDNDPYPVITKGRIVWVVDAYTTTAAYPYSAPTLGGDNLGPAVRFNYMRGAVKATVDAYDGNIALYITDESDPILTCYRRAIPGLFRPASAIPAFLREHRRFPEDLFAVQRRLLTEYHVADPDLFYNRADAWQIARLRSGADTPISNAATTPLGDRRDSAPYYALIRLPGETQEEFALMTAFTPHSRENLTALLVARCDAAHYGERILYRFPASGMVDGPERIRKRIRSDNRILAYFAATEKAGTRFLPGAMQILPIGGNLVYFQPLYARADQSDDGGRGLSSLKQIIAVHNDRIVMESDLPQTVRSLLGGDFPNDANIDLKPNTQRLKPNSLSPAALIEQANDAYERGQAALRAGDFAAYGRESKRLGEVLRRLRKGG